MKALITGASSGIGKDMAYYLSDLGYDLIIVGRNINALNSLKNDLKTNVKVIEMDLSVKENVYKLYEECKNDNIDVLINNAGFGLFGNFHETSLDKELDMINVNIVAVHIRHIREKIEIDATNPRYLKVIWGQGYKMENEMKLVIDEWGCWHPDGS